MMRIYSVSLPELTNLCKRYSLDKEKVYKLIMDFLSHRREEILNIKLDMYFSDRQLDVKKELKPILYKLINELDISGNVCEVSIVKSIFYFKDNSDELRESDY